jgi:hypothetical protein
VPTEEAKQEGAETPEEMLKSTHTDKSKDSEEKTGGADDELD